MTSIRKNVKYTFKWGYGQQSSAVYNANCRSLREAFSRWNYMNSFKDYYTVVGTISSVTTTTNVLTGESSTDIHEYSLSEIVKGRRTKNTSKTESKI
jgi:hypothetical protein